MVLGGEADVLHARLLRQVKPHIGVETGGVELVEQLLVLPSWDLPAPLDLLVPRRDGIHTPVHEQAEALIEEPVASVAESGWHGAVTSGI